MSSWTQFFRDAGIPSSVSKSYASIFEDNRISKDMLLDLNKEILNDMGIKVMGDVISILKHSKKVHSKESRKSEMAGSAPKPSSSKMPAAHSTTPGGQGAAVSTTSVGSVRRTKGLGEFASDTPADSWAHEVFAGESLQPRASFQDSLDVERVDTTVEPLNIHSTLRSDNMLSEYVVDDMDVVPASRRHYDVQPLEEYTTAAYENRQKRPLTMYSDELEFSPPKHPRVITVPNESQDIYTTTAIQNAAAIVAAVESQKLLAGNASGGSDGEGSPISERNRRLLEAAGLIPMQQKERTTSVFSRLDHNPSSTIHHIAKAQQIDSATRITLDSTKPRRIQLTRPAAVSGSGTKGPDSNPLPKRLVKTPVVKVTTTSSAQSTNKAKLSSRFSGRLGGKKEQLPVARSASEGIFATEHTIAQSASQPSMKLGIRKKDSSSKMTERLGVRVRGNTSERIRLPAKVKTKPGVSLSMKGSRSAPKLAVETSKPSMVADEYEYQTQRQMDIRSRLEKKEMEKKARRRGLLPGRLGQHHVFGRLE